MSKSEKKLIEDLHEVYYTIFDLCNDLPGYLDLISRKQFYIYDTEADLYK